MFHDVLHNLIERKWNDAARDWNPSEFARLYADDAVFYGGRKGHSAGRAQIAEYFDSYSNDFRGVTLKLIDQEIREIGENAFLAQGYGDFKFHFRDGSQSESRLRTSLVIVSRAGEWQILLHHFSPTPDAPPLGNQAPASAA